jgi:hypothetical protein
MSELPPLSTNEETSLAALGPKIRTAEDKRTRKRPFKVRAALAGLYLLQGHGSLKACLERAGFSEETARCSKAHGLTEKDCLRALEQWNNEATPSRLVKTARERAVQALDLMDPATVPVQHLARFVEMIEKFHGDRQIQPLADAARAADRLTVVFNLVTMMRDRGIMAPTLETVAVRSESSPSCDSAERKVAVPPMSDNDHCVNSDGGEKSAADRAFIEAGGGPPGRPQPESINPLPGMDTKS